MTRQKYTVIFAHGDRPNQWIASIKEIPECHTFGRGLAQTRARIREALVLWEGAEAKSAELLEVLPLPKQTKAKISRLELLRRKMDRLAKETRSQQDEVVAALLGDWSMRDIGQILDLSHQRVNQVAGARSKRRSRRVTPSPK